MSHRSSSTLAPLCPPEDRGGAQPSSASAEMEARLRDLALRVDKHIEEFLPRELDEEALRHYAGAPAWKYDPQASTECLSKPVWDLLERRGKRWRPVFGMLLLEALGVPPEPYEALLSLTGELSHSGSLIIDDIQDASLLRRNEDCIHHRYGDAVAINAANTLYFLPFLHIFEHPKLPSEKRAKITEVTIRQCIRAHFGQGWDIYWSRHLSPITLGTWLDESIVEKVLQMYHFKTGALVEGIAEVAAIIADAADAVRRASMDFARDFSVAFQMIDDLHNFSGSPDWTKQHAEDLMEGKLTFVVVSALQRLGGAERDRLSEILCSPSLRRNPVALAEAVALVQSSGAPGACCTQAEALSEGAWQAFAAAVPNSPARMTLRAMTLRLLGRGNEREAAGSPGVGS